MTKVDGRTTGESHDPLDEGLWQKWIGDGRPLLAAAAAALVFSGGFAIFLSLTADLLPQDVHYLGMTADDLCRINCRIVDFMVHDRASFGGSLVGIGILYLWLVTFPLSDGEGWAWWTLATTGAFGFATFLSYLGYGYLDTWHGIGTVLLLPVFVLGLVKSRSLVTSGGDARGCVASVLRARSRLDLGRLIILVGAVGVVASGVTILAIGMSHVFVPEDTHFIGLTRTEIDAISPRLVALIAHDRAGFGGAVAVMGAITLMSLAWARPSRSLFQAVALAGLVSLGAAFAIHFAVGYQDLWHLTPPALGALSLITGLLLIGSTGREQRPDPR